MSSAARRTEPPPEGRSPVTALVEIVVTDGLDADSVRELSVILDSALVLRPRRLVLEMAACQRVDAVGIGLLLDAHRRMWRLGGRLVLRSPSPRLRRLLEVARVDRVLQMSMAPAATGIPAVADAGSGEGDG